MLEVRVVGDRAAVAAGPRGARAQQRAQAVLGVVEAVGALDRAQAAQRARLLGPLDLDGGAALARARLPARARGLSAEERAPVERGRALGAVALALAAGRELDDGVVVGREAGRAGAHLDELGLGDERAVARLLEAEQPRGAAGDGQGLGSLARRRGRAARRLGRPGREDELGVADEELGDDGLHADALERGHAPHLELLAAQQVGRPDDGDVARRHARLLAARGHAHQVPHEVLERPASRNIRVSGRLG